MSARGKVILKAIALAMGSIAWLSLGSPAADAATLPAHGVNVQCSVGQVEVQQVWAYGTVTYPTRETVYWGAYLQRWNGSSWATVGSFTGWQKFQTSAPNLSVEVGGLFWISVGSWDLQQGGKYRVASLFYWSRTATYSPWELTTPCEIAGLVVT